MVFQLNKSVRWTKKKTTLFKVNFIHTIGWDRFYLMNQFRVSHVTKRAPRMKKNVVITTRNIST